MPELDYCEVLQQFGLVPWLQDRLQPDHAEDDVLLAAVVLLGTAACDEDCAVLICKAAILSALIELLKGWYLLYLMTLYRTWLKLVKIGPFFVLPMKKCILLHVGMDNTYDWPSFLHHRINS